MAYFLKKTKRNDRLYLSIYESFYSPETKNTRHKSFRKIGFVDALIEQGIDDPISHFQKEVNELNSKRETEKCRINFQQISDVSPELCLGYVPIAKILNILDVKEHFGYLSSSRKFEFDVYDVFSALVYARVVAPLSKHQTFHDILPKLYVQKNFSYDQLLEGLEFMGEEYEKLVEILTVATDDNFILDSSRSYFDCTNYYFEIDKESTLQKRGPSKENRKDPIVGMGLLLDAQMLPIGMKIFPGNESEKPVMRDLIHDLKSRNNIKGRTIQIADKGLNCAKNIIEAIDNGDGYLFSKSVKTLPERERQWVLLDDGFETVFNQNGEPVYKIKECIDTFTYSYKDDYGNVITRNIKERLCHNKQLINSHFYRGVSELPYKLLFAVIYTHLEFRYEVSHTITSHHVHHFHQTRIPDGTLLDYMVQYRKPLFPQFFLYPKKFLPENNPHHKEFHLRPYIQNNANQ